MARGDKIEVGPERGFSRISLNDVIQEAPTPGSTITINVGHVREYLGEPTGVPAFIQGHIPLGLDITTHILWAYIGGNWNAIGSSGSGGSVPGGPTNAINVVYNNLDYPSVDAALDYLLSLPPPEQGAPETSHDITVAGVNIGGYTDGEVITAGTPLETVLENMLRAVIPPTYYSPTLSISGNVSTPIEAGTSINPTIVPTFTQRDAGTATNYVLKKNGSNIYSGAIAQQTDPAFVLGDTSVSYSATVTYNEGVIKNDNQGVPYPTGHIIAGSINSGAITYTGVRKAFYAADTGSTPTTSAHIRALANNVNSPVNGTAFTINIPVSCTRVCFAYPTTLRDVSTVKYVELGNGEVKDTFTLSTISVQGANSYQGINYKVYTYIPAIPFGATATYTVTI